MRVAAVIGAIVLAAVTGRAELVLSSVEDRAALEERAPPTRHTLWKIEDAKKPMYLLGSIHVLRRQNYPLERPIEDAFDDAKVVAFEVDLVGPPAAPAKAPVDQPSAASPAAASPAPRAKPASVRVPKANALKAQVSPATYRSVVQYLENAGYPGSVFDQLPAPLVATALVQMEVSQLGFEPQWGVDAYFYRRAKKYGKTIVGLETPQDQVDAMGSLSETASDALVQAALDDVVGLRPMLRDLVRAWKGGELDRLVSLVNGSFADRPELFQRVIIDRNARWIPKIEALIEGGVPAIVIVGTGHLVGPDSVVAMLEAKGHVVKQQ
jgi:uncharacterized protein YbaP (TraB family)